jgi:transposase
MMLSIAYSVGIDIAKDTLDIAFYPGGETFCLPNDASGHRALIKRLGGLDVLRVVFEATGAYHRKLQRVLSEAGLPLVKVNPRRARRFAEAAGNSPRPTEPTRSCWPAWAQPSNSSLGRSSPKRSR